MAAIKVAVIGVGRPIKPSFLFSSRLNLASLIAEEMGIVNATKEISENGRLKWIFPSVCALIIWNNINAGANPEVIKSAMLSSSTPNLFSTFKILAKNPSKKSRKIPIKIKAPA